MYCKKRPLQCLDVWSTLCGSTQVLLDTSWVQLHRVLLFLLFFVSRQISNQLYRCILSHSVLQCVDTALKSKKATWRFVCKHTPEQLHTILHILRIKHTGHIKHQAWQLKIIMPLKRGSKPQGHKGGTLKAIKGELPFAVGPTFSLTKHDFLESLLKNMHNS